MASEESQFAKEYLLRVRDQSALSMASSTYVALTLRNVKGGIGQRLSA